MKQKQPTYAQLREMYLQACEQNHLDTINIHNKLGEPERQAKETLYSYRQRLKAKALVVGYSEDDYIIL